jgi:hypothetical protein
VDDDLWALIKPLLPPWPGKSPDPRPVTDRLCRQGILHDHIAWQLLPLELGFGECTVSEDGSIGEPCAKGSPTGHLPAASLTSAPPETEPSSSRLP